MAYQTLNQVNMKGQTAVLRADLNVPLENGHITDPSRIDRSLKTIKELLEGGARVMLLAHLGRPEGPTPDLSLAPIVAYLKTQLPHASISLAPLEEASASTSALTVIENIRFYAGEEKNDPDFVRKLAALGDFFVNDGFSVSHRAHASTEGITHFLPSYAGRLMEEELHALGQALENPERPVMAIVGGAKISTKLPVLNHLMTKVDKLVIGGAMANTFLAAQGHSVGTSLYEPDLLEVAREILASAHSCEIILPLDVVIAPALAPDAPHKSVSIAHVKAGHKILDLGPLSQSNVAEKMGECKTLLWNGPLGVFEVPPFDAGTNEVAKAASKLTRLGYLTSIAGGGDTVAALAHAGVLEDLSYVSTAGGAFLEYIEGKELPGVRALYTR